MFRTLFPDAAEHAGPSGKGAGLESVRIALSHWKRCCDWLDARPLHPDFDARAEATVGMIRDAGRMAEAYRERRGMSARAMAELLDSGGL